MCVCVYVCVCVREREREIERVSVCVSVCVCVGVGVETKKQRAFRISKKKNCWREGREAVCGLKLLVYAAFGYQCLRP
jgi:hypothetical protein